MIATGCLHFGLLVGQHSGLHQLGLVGLLVKYSPDVGTALRSLARYFHLRARGAVVTLTLDGDAAMLGYEFYQRQSEASDQSCRRRPRVRVQHHAHPVRSDLEDPAKFASPTASPRMWGRSVASLNAR